MNNVEMIYNEVRDEYDVETNLVFDGETCYVVGYDTCGNGVVFDTSVYVCYNKEELISEIIRVVDEHDIELDMSLQDSITLQEKLVIAQLLNLECKSKIISTCPHCEKVL